MAEQQKTREEECEGHQSPSLGTEAEIETEQGGVDLQTTSTQLKHQQP